MADAYRVLNISPTASTQEIRSNYVQLACQHHPCNSERKRVQPVANHTQFRLVAEAFFLIGDDLRRELYDLIKSTSNGYQPPAHHYHPNLDGFTRRSRAYSELTIDLRVGLPPELRALLIELDPIKLFNRVVNQIDQERKQHAKSAQQSAISLRISPTVPGGIHPLTGDHPPVITASSNSKYLSPYHYFLDESKLQPSSRSPPKPSAVREDALGRQQQQQQPPPHLNSKPPGILRDESKSQFRRRPISNLTASLKQDPAENCYRPSGTAELHGEPVVSMGRSRASSYLSNAATSVSTASSQRNTRSRRVSFSNDVIETDELKQAREVVMSFRSEIARKSTKPAAVPNPSSVPAPPTESSSTWTPPGPKPGPSTQPSARNSPPTLYAGPSTGETPLPDRALLYAEPLPAGGRLPHAFTPTQPILIQAGLPHAGGRRGYRELPDARPFLGGGPRSAPTHGSYPELGTDGSPDGAGSLGYPNHTLRFFRPPPPPPPPLLPSDTLSTAATFVLRRLSPSNTVPSSRPASRSPRRDGN